MNPVCKDALDETRGVLSELSVFLLTVQKRNPQASHPELTRISSMLDSIVMEIDDLEEMRPQRTGSY